MKRKPLATRAQQDVMSVQTLLMDARDHQLTLVGSPDLCARDRSAAAIVLGNIMAALALSKDVQGEQEEIIEVPGNGKEKRTG